MKKVLLVACMLLLLAFHQTQAAPIQPKPIMFQPFSSVTKSITNTSTSHVFRLQSTNGITGAVTTIYARLQYENEYQSGDGLYGDVIVRFYEDEGGEIPTSVSGLIVNFRVIGFDGSSGYDFYDDQTANGEYLVIVTNSEHDYNDGVTQRYRDYHLAAGDYNVADGSW